MSDKTIDPSELDSFFSDVSESMLTRENSEVVAVDPHQVDVAVGDAGLPFGEDSVEGVAGVGNRHPAQRHSGLPRSGNEDIVDVGVALLVAAVHPQRHRLPLGLLGDLRPRRLRGLHRSGIRSGARHQRARRNQNRRRGERTPAHGHRPGAGR